MNFLQIIKSLFIVIRLLPLQVIKSCIGLLRLASGFLLPYNILHTAGTTAYLLAYFLKVDWYKP